jgi:hypothetical protein
MMGFAGQGLLYRPGPNRLNPRSANNKSPGSVACLRRLLEGDFSSNLLARHKRISGKSACTRVYQDEVAEIGGALEAHRRGLCEWVYLYVLRTLRDYTSQEGDLGVLQRSDARKVLRALLGVHSGTGSGREGKGSTTGLWSQTNSWLWRLFKAGRILPSATWVPSCDSLSSDLTIDEWRSAGDRPVSG